MKDKEYPITPAIRMLREKKIAFTPHLYDYVERGGTARSAAELDVDEHAVIKTLVMETDHKEVLIVLMHGDSEVSTKELARHLKVKTITPCDPARAQKHTGYLVGGTSPLATKIVLPIYAEKTIFALPLIYLNGGKRGFLISLDPQILKSVLPINEVAVAN